MVGICILLGLFTFSSFAQGYEEAPKDDTPWYEDHLVVGGGVSVVLGSTGIFEITPLFGYRVIPRLVVGVGPTYTYFFDSGNEITYNLLGGRLNAKYYLVEGITAQVEFDVARIGVNYFNNKSNQILPARAMVGLGYTSEFFKGFGYSVEVLYDVARKYPVNINVDSGTTTQSFSFDRNQFRVSPTFGLVYRTGFFYNF